MKSVKKAISNGGDKIILRSIKTPHYILKKSNAHLNKNFGKSFTDTLQSEKKFRTYSDL